jgi:2'-5' RNA ligase
VTPGPGEARVLGVALAIPDPFGAQLQEHRERLGDPDARSIPTHITLLPPTTVDAVLLPEIGDHLVAVAERTRPFPVRLRGTGSFRPVSPVVFVTVAEGIAACELLETRVRSAVLWRPLPFSYHPHVTVAHHLPEASLDQALDGLADYAADFTVDRFSLYEHLGGVWTAYREFVFGGPG